ncbi:sensor histidine kinase [Marinobacterium rhizophilum]|uniref:histidine kinase n=1 Tax=Marinobacterium rhizophilum TaxID=420402 RepID=A0ABY5HQF6_9GAMM|nr:response regulator [Marinobacterium rhizophilum]UTW13400.1 response regulator [Marinobacterium rhizophilum]
MHDSTLLLTRPKILMVDDKPENLLVLERLLRHLPVELYRAASGNEALRLTLHHDFALALLDIQMPEMDGYELAELLRQEEKTAKMPFIFISAIYTEHINIFHGYEKGAFSYIVKPFKPEVLLNKVKLFIDMYEHEQELHRRTEELEAANKELEAFSYSVSHDLRAPLRAIDGFSQALMEDYGDQLGDVGSDYLARVRAAAQRMGTLIDALLSLSRISRAGLNRSSLDISALAESVMADIRGSDPDRKVELVIAPAAIVQADPHLIRAVLENLMNNAWKYSGKCQVAKIEFGLDLLNGETCYYVRDNGAGFDMAYADKLFGAFQRLHHEQEYPGTGIGLATVQRIIHRHAGRIWAQAAVGEGATFYFTLPNGEGHGA